MFCSRCGKQIADGSTFCSKCGAKILQAIPNEVYKTPEKAANPAMQPAGIVEKQQRSQKIKKLPSWAIPVLAVCGSLIFILLIMFFITLARIGKLKRELSSIDAVTSDNTGSDYADISDMEYIPAGVSNEEAHLGYINFLKAISEENGANKVWSEYTVYDMNDDGVDELIAIIGSQRSGQAIYIATYCDGSLIYFDDLNDDRVEVRPYGDPNGGLDVYSLSYNTDDNYTQSVVRYLISGDELYEEDITKEYNRNVDDFKDSDYGAYDLDLYKLDNLSPLGGSVKDTGSYDTSENTQDNSLTQSDAGKTPDTPNTSDTVQTSDSVALTQEEIEFFTEYVQRKDVYGFLCSSYKVPIEADLNEVFYNGAGLGITNIPDKERAAYMKAADTDEIWGDLMKIPASDIDTFLIDKVGLDNSYMKKPFGSGWIYIKEYDAYYAERGDTNYQPFECASGTKNGNIYTLNIVNWKQKPYATFQINKVRDDKYMILNNEIIFGK